MTRRKKQEKSTLQAQSNGILCLVVGFVVLFVRLPIIGYSLRPIAWLLIVVGLILLAMPSFVAYMKQELIKRESDKRAEPPGIFSGGKVVSPSKRWTSTESSTFGRGAGQRIDPIMDSPSPGTGTGPKPRQEWSADVFKEIEWRRFESVCEHLFCQAGFTSKSQSHGADGGVDIWLYSKNSVGPAAIVQCKHWRKTPVGVKELREFFGVMASHKLTRGTYATSSVFTKDAQEFARLNGINAMDGARLLAQIDQRTPEQQQALLAIAYEGEYWLPTCASCGVKMVERGKPEKRFWGCANFPKCRNTIAKSST